MKFQEALDKSQAQKDSLLCACALLAGALWPAFSRIRALTTQRNILSEYLKTLESLREQTNNLSEMLSSEMDREEKAERSRSRRVFFGDGRQPMLVFRAGVIAVIAANRLYYFSSCTSKAFASSESPGELGGVSVVCSGGVSKARVDFRGKGKSVLDISVFPSIRILLYRSRNGIKRIEITLRIENDGLLFISVHVLPS